MSESEIVGVLIPDHPDLCGQLGAALEFGGALRQANDSEINDSPWHLPAQLIAPELEQALDAAVFHDWHFRVGAPKAQQRDPSPTGDDPVIGVRHEGIGHMGVYVTAATRAQLELLSAAAELLTHAEYTAPEQRLPETQEVAEFVEEWRAADQSGEYDASLAAWLTVVQMLTIAIAPAPTFTQRPSAMYNTEAILLPTASTEGTSPAADTATVLQRIDPDTGHPINLDNAAWRAWQRLTAEWHTAICEPNNLLKTYAY